MIQVHCLSCGRLSEEADRPPPLCVSCIHSPKWANYLLRMRADVTAYQKALEDAAAKMEAQAIQGLNLRPIQWDKNVLPLPIVHRNVTFNLKKLTTGYRRFFGHVKCADLGVLPDRVDVRVTNTLGKENVSMAMVGVPQLDDDEDPQPIIVEGRA